MVQNTYYKRYSKAGLSNKWFILIVSTGGEINGVKQKKQKIENNIIPKQVNN